MDHGQTSCAVGHKIQVLVSAIGGFTLHRINFRQDKHCIVHVIPVNNKNCRIPQCIRNIGPRKASPGCRNNKAHQRQTQTANTLPIF